MSFFVANAAALRPSMTRYAVGAALAVGTGIGVENSLGDGRRSGTHVRIGVGSLATVGSAAGAVAALSCLTGKQMRSPGLAGAAMGASALAGLAGSHAFNSLRAESPQRARERELARALEGIPVAAGTEVDREFFEGIEFDNGYSIIDTEGIVGSRSGYRTDETAISAAQLIAQHKDMDIVVTEHPDGRVFLAYIDGPTDKLGDQLPDYSTADPAVVATVSSFGKLGRFSSSD